jgi:hypothetical protein
MHPRSVGHGPSKRRGRAPSEHRRFLSPRVTTAGRIAGYTTALCLAVVSVAYMAASWDELTCRPHACTREAAKAGLVWLAASAASALAGAIAWTVRRSPADPEGGSGWTWGLAVLFIGGTWIAVTRIPSLTCPAGYHLDVGFRMCIGSLDRFEATDWTWLKALLWSVSALVALTVIRSPRAMPWSAGVAALAWLVGTGWYLYDTLLKTVG